MPSNATRAKRSARIPPQLQSGPAIVRLRDGRVCTGYTVLDGSAILMPQGRLRERNPDRLYPPRPRMWPLSEIKEVRWN